MGMRFGKLTPLIFGTALWVLPVGEPAVAQTAAAPPPPAVTVAAPLQRPVTEWQEYTARLEPSARIELRPRITGSVDAVNFRDGQLVKAGDLLFTIDKRPFQIAVETAKATVASAKAKLDLANLELSRAVPLARDQFTSKSTLDNRQADVRDAQATLDSANAALHRAELDLSWTEVRAPADGRVSSRRVDPGNLVQENTTLLTTILAQSEVYAVFDMSEADYLTFARHAQGPGWASGSSAAGEVQLRLADEADWTANGRMDFLDTEIDPRSGTVRARATVANKDGLLIPGTFARLRLKGDVETALLVPDAAIAADQAARMVMTVTPDNTVAPKPVTLGPIVDGLRVIRTGLVAEDRVVIDGLHMARPGSKVTPQPGQVQAADAAGTAASPTHLAAAR